MTDIYKILYKMSSRNATLTEGGCRGNPPSLSRTLHTALYVYIYLHLVNVYSTVGRSSVHRSARNTAEQERHCTIGRHGKDII